MHNSIDTAAKQKYSVRCPARGRPCLVAKCFPQRLAQVLHDLLRPDAAHRAQRQGADELVRVVGVLHERLHREQGQLRLRLGVVDQVRVHQLLQLDVLCSRRGGAGAVVVVGEGWFRTTREVNTVAWKGGQRGGGMGSVFNRPYPKGRLGLLRTGETNFP